MKAVQFALLLSVPLAVAAAEVRTGDNLNEVRAAMGAPRGQVKAGYRQMLYYDRGEVEMQAGVVTRVALLSEADYTALEARRAVEAARVNEENTRLDAQGEALKARKLADSNFLSAPLAYQIAFWQDFSRRYPGVSVAEQLMIARLRLAEQFNQRHAEEERLAELEARVNNAEARAQAADSNSDRFASYVGYGGYYGGRDRRGFTLWPVQYHYFSSPDPVVYPMNRPVVTPMYTEARRTNDTSDCDRRDSRSSGRRSRM